MANHSPSTRDSAPRTVPASGAQRPSTRTRKRPTGGEVDARILTNAAKKIAEKYPTFMSADYGGTLSDEYNDGYLDGYMTGFARALDALEHLAADLRTGK